MSSMPQHLRYERKFVAERFSLAEVLGGVRRHAASFREVYPPRVVNNIYLDSPVHRDYFDHVNGTAQRTKTRVRWYGQKLDAAVHPKLERKLKRGTVGGKETYALPRLSLDGGPLRSVLNRVFDAAALPPMVRQGLRHQEPALFNCYHRHYFASRDGRFRLTVDSHLQFAAVAHDQWTAIRPGSAMPAVIIELKFAPERAGEAEILTNDLPFRLTRFSKYVTGMERTCLRPWQRS